MSSEDFNVEVFRKDLEHVRVWKEWSQEEMAKALGVEQNTYSAFKVGTSGSMKPRALVRGMRLVEEWKSVMAARVWREQWPGRGDYDPHDPLEILVDSVETVARVLASSQMEAVERVRVARRNLEQMLDVLFPQVERAVRERGKEGGGIT